jgi:predicted glycoside hydrolase/deacetylase ChbG (UPF0249 family)
VPAEPRGARRILIVNADDFGRSPGVNRGVARAHQEGIVTSASLMVRWPEAVAAAAFARRHPSLSVGLHVDLGEWICRDRVWSPVYEVVSLDDASGARKEILGQVERFRALVGRAPTHIDAHQHVHRHPHVRPLLLDLAAGLGVPLRGFSAVQYCGQFYGQTADGVSMPAAIEVDAAIAIIASLPDGISELACHPAEVADFDTMYAAERVRELATLCAPRLRDALAREGVALRSFHDVVPPAIP